jgi:hypothetical protein
MLAMGMIFNKLYEDPNFGAACPFLAVDMPIPANQMGRVLGKSKVKIRAIEYRTGVYIRVPDRGSSVEKPVETTVADGAEADVENQASNGEMSYLTIRGMFPEIAGAVSMLKDILYGEAPFFATPQPPPNYSMEPHHSNDAAFRGRPRY